MLRARRPSGDSCAIVIACAMRQARPQSCRLSIARAQQDSERRKRPIEALNERVRCRFRWSSSWAASFIQSQVCEFEYHTLLNNEADAGHPQRQHFAYTYDTPCTGEGSWGALRLSHCTVCEEDWATDSGLCQQCERVGDGADLFLEQGHIHMSCLCTACDEERCIACDQSCMKTQEQK